MFRWKETQQSRNSVLRAVQRMPLSKKEERAAKKEDACFVIENLPQQMGSGVSEPTGKPTGLLLLLVELDAL